MGVQDATAMLRIATEAARAQVGEDEVAVAVGYKVGAWRV